MRAVVKTTLNIILMKSNMMMVMAVMVLIAARWTIMRAKLKFVIF